MKTMVNGRTVELKVMDDVRRACTDMVAKYLMRGYTFNLVTESGTQGEIAKYDLTNNGGKTVIRIMIVEDRENFGDRFYESVDTLVIRVKEYEDLRSSRHDTLWNSKGNLIEEKVFYYVTEKFSNNILLTDDYDLIKAIFNLRQNRLSSKPLRNSVPSEEVTSANMIKVAYRACRKIPGFKSVKVSEIEKVVRTWNRENHVCYKVYFSNNSKKHIPATIEM